MKNFIKQIRKDRKLSTEALAAKIAGTSPQQINYLENGKRKLTWDWIQKIAQALECHPLEITDGPITGILPRNEQEKELLKRFRGFSSGEQKMFSHMLDTFSKETPLKKDKDDSDAPPAKKEEKNHE